MRSRELLRRRIQRQVYATVHGAGLDPTRYDRPAGDPGLFGPDSVVWLVHGDMPGMFTGGVAALMLQSLHPLAMAGVDQHSRYREDPIDRLNRTAGFVTVTSYGSTAEAEAAIERVRRVHDRVRGIAQDGRPYDAADPDLLRWVHVAETACFLAGYQRYARTPLTRPQQDRYFEEYALVAERLGATGVPRSLAEVRAYLRDVRPSLAASEAALAAVEFLLTPGALVQDRARGLALRVLVAGGADLLPSWAAAELCLPRHGALRVSRDRAAVRALATALRYGCEPSVVITTARARALAPAADAPRTPPPPRS
ncbi:oxygenase MpaB family protein [Streptacidiphilus neutrinimicus]|uniref:oxygenase MpaB family protein n=1 Tax=Streptacidiphilus neutrinimicus TaxID=105420 RepID=UPI0005A95FEB|nr:oxygenase MpaB family protein [Streptacidiphilus neutrinimicus]